jgi:glycogen(starch) synthase
MPLIKRAGQRNMKILYWTPLFWPEIGGIETASAGLLQGLSKKNCEFMVFTSHGRKKLKDESNYKGIPVNRFPIATALIKRDIGQIKYIINKAIDIKDRFMPDLVHVNFGGPAPVSYMHIKTNVTAQTPYILSLHNSVKGMDSSNDTILGEMFRSCSWITTCSESMTRDARQVMPDISDKLSTIYYGLEMPKINPAPLHFTKPHILCIGRLVEEKGFDLALKAFSLIKDRYPKMRMTIAGDGPALPSLKEQALRLDIRNRIKFTGSIPRRLVPQLINQAVIVAVPSRWREAFGLVALEAAQMGRPVIAASVGGLKEVVAHTETGLLVEKENPKALAKAIVYLLENREEAAQMGLASHRKAQGFFSLNRYVQSYLEIYEKVVTENKRT